MRPLLWEGKLYPERQEKNLKSNMTESTLGQKYQAKSVGLLAHMVLVGAHREGSVTQSRH